MTYSALISVKPQKILKETVKVKDIYKQIIKIRPFFPNFKSKYANKLMWHFYFRITVQVIWKSYHNWHNCIIIQSMMFCGLCCKKVDEMYHCHITMAMISYLPYLSSSP